MALSQTQVGELVMQLCGGGLANLQLDRHAGNKQASTLVVSVRDSKTKHVTHRNRLGNQLSVLTAELLAVGLRSFTVLAVPAIGTSPLISCPVSVGFPVGAEHVALSTTPVLQ